MYQGENAKFAVTFKDHVGNIIPATSILFVKILIYREKDREIYLKYSAVQEFPVTAFNPLAGDNSIEVDTENNIFSFIVSATDTINLPIGTYIINIRSISNSADISEGLSNIEEAPIFTIRETIKEDVDAN